MPFPGHHGLLITVAPQSLTPGSACQQAQQIPSSRESTLRVGIRRWKRKSGAAGGGALSGYGCSEAGQNLGCSGKPDQGGEWCTRVVPGTHCIPNGRARTIQDLSTTRLTPLLSSWDTWECLPDHPKVQYLIAQRR